MIVADTLLVIPSYKTSSTNLGAEFPIFGHQNILRTDLPP